MKSGVFSFFTKSVLLVVFSLGYISVTAQDSPGFADKLRFGGSIGMAFGNEYTDITIAPGVLYEVNEYYGVGVALQGSYANQKEVYESYMYGGSLINIFNPIPQVQLSVELEQLRVNLNYEPEFSSYYNIPDRDFWNTALYLGAGYRTNNVTVGIRYNVLFDDDDYVYSEAWMPFVRVYF
jgi:hypothetical protein